MFCLYRKSFCIETNHTCSVYLFCCPGHEHAQWALRCNFCFFFCFFLYTSLSIALSHKEKERETGKRGQRHKYKKNTRTSQCWRSRGLTICRWSIYRGLMVRGTWLPLKSYWTCKEVLCSQQKTHMSHGDIVERTYRWHAPTDVLIIILHYV